MAQWDKSDSIPSDGLANLVFAQLFQRLDQCSDSMTNENVAPFAKYTL